MGRARRQLQANATTSGRYVNTAAKRGDVPVKKNAGSTSTVWIEKHIAEHGAYLWHATTPTRLPLIAEHGLRPAASSLYGERERYSPRPDCVYLGRLDFVRRHYGEPQLRVDLRELDPINLVCDEDVIDPHCTSIAFWNVCDQPEVSELLGQVPAVPAPKWDASLQTVGEWANANDLINSPEIAAFSLRTGVIAHRGALPETAVAAMTAPHPDPKTGPWRPGHPGMLMLCAMHGVDDLWHPTGAFTLNSVCDDVAYERACHRVQMLNTILCAGAITADGCVWIDGVYAEDSLGEELALVCQQTDSRLRYQGLHEDVFAIHDPSYQSRQALIAASRS